jgi:hypothetical protein
MHRAAFYVPIAQFLSDFLAKQLCQKAKKVGSPP